MRKRALRLAAAAIAGLAALPAVAVPASATGRAPDTCISDYVWRLARPTDFVCVKPAVRAQTAWDNKVKASRWKNGVNGPHTCFTTQLVWRGAFPGDDVCVRHHVREQVLADNAAAASRRAVASPIVLYRRVNFSDGVPVGGWTKLTVHNNGSYQWTGHMHVSGGTSYNYAGACVLRLSSGTAFVFQTSGRLRGYFDPGSRDHNWNKEGTIPALPTAWSKSSSYQVNCQNKVKLNIEGTVKLALQAVSTAYTVIKIVA